VEQVLVFLDIWSSVYKKEHTTQQTSENGIKTACMKENNDIQNITQKIKIEQHEPRLFLTIFGISELISKKGYWCK
jgi:hypothetical protein